MQVSFDLRALGAARDKLKDAVEKGVQDLERQRVLLDEMQRQNASTQADNLLLHKELQDLRIQMNEEIQGLKDTKQARHRKHHRTTSNGIAHPVVRSTYFTQPAYCRDCSTPLV